MRALASCAICALAACSSGPAPSTVQPLNMQSSAVQGQATDYSVASRADRARFANLVPSGVAASAIRIGNDNCYYYVNGPVMARLVPSPNAATQICK